MRNEMRRRGGLGVGETAKLRDGPFFKARLIDILDDQVLRAGPSSHCADKGQVGDDRPWPGAAGAQRRGKASRPLSVVHPGRDTFATGTGPDIAEGGEHLVGAVNANDKAYPVGPGDYAPVAIPLFGHLITDLGC